MTWRTLTEPYSLQFNNGDGTFSQVRMTGVRTLSGCIALVDFDQDGMLDVFEAALGNTNLLYRNLGNRTFARMTSAGVGSVTAFGTYGGGSWADYDDDGFPDLFRTQGVASPVLTGHYTLARNKGDGTFVPITRGSIVSDTPPNGSGSYAGLWFDFNNDGFMDLYTINGDDNGDKTQYPHRFYRGVAP